MLLIINVLVAVPNSLIVCLVLFISSVLSFNHDIVCFGIAVAVQAKVASVPASNVSELKGVMTTGASI